ncbi:MAG: hypothetical protein IJ017_04190 [Oscillospiraceae bacterium]|nr:hypothetical protein [Oscillospiraceae bacterium]
MSTQLSPEILKLFTDFQQAELDGVLTYQKLAELTDDEQLKAAFKEAAADEGRHAAVLKSYTNANLTPNSAGAEQLAAAAAMFDMSTLLDGMSKGEYAGYDVYAPLIKDYPLLESVMNDERKHGEMLAAEAERLRNK